MTLLNTQAGSAALIREWLSFCSNLLYAYTHAVEPIVEFKTLSQGSFFLTNLSIRTLASKYVQTNTGMPHRLTENWHTTVIYGTDFDLHAKESTYSTGHIPLKSET
jgi:hypothetical protein